MLEHISDPELERFIAQKKKAATARPSVPTKLHNHLEQFDGAFNRRGSDSTQSHSELGGSVQNGEVRERRLQDQLHDARMNEPLPEQRLRVVPREVWEKKDGIVRTKMREYYGGRCQVCTWTFPKADGEPYFEGLYLVSRTLQRWLDHPGNILCLCPNCCAKMLYGAKECPDVARNILGIDSRHAPEHDFRIEMKLCGEQVTLSFCPAHILDVRAVLRESSV